MGGNRGTTRLSAFAAAAVIYAALQATAGAVEFEPTIEKARAKEAAPEGEPKKLLVVTFGADWCKWCRKLEADTFMDERVGALSDKFLWVKVDVDEQKELAARFRVQGLPQTFVLDGDDRIIAVRPGYAAPEEFVKFLKDALANPQPPEDLFFNLLKRLQADEADEERRETVAQLVEHLARPERDGRDVILLAMSQTKSGLLPPLIELMEDDRLAVRAAASGTFLKLTRADLEFDPFADKTQRERQLDAWKKWLTSRPVSKPRPQKETTPSESK